MFSICLLASQIPTDVDKTSLDHGKTSVGYGSTLVWPEDLGYQMLYRTSSNYLLIWYLLSTGWGCQICPNIGILIVFNHLAWAYSGCIISGWVQFVLQPKGMLG